MLKGLVYCLVIFATSAVRLKQYEHEPYLLNKPLNWDKNGVINYPSTVFFMLKILPLVSISTTTNSLGISQIRYSMTRIKKRK